jgi:hypothetical protein
LRRVDQNRPHATDWLERPWTVGDQPPRIEVAGECRLLEPWAAKPPQKFFSGIEQALLSLQGDISREALRRPPMSWRMSVA